MLVVRLIYYVCSFLSLPGHLSTREVVVVVFLPWTPLIKFILIVPRVLMDSDLLKF